MSLAQYKPIKVNLENWDTSQDTVSPYPIDLIIKPTVACNFKCTFCSSTYLSDDKQDELDLRYLARFFDHYPKTSTIIINGGDPLMMSPDYYWKIIEMLDERNMHRTTLSFTTNLWLFYKNPDKWSPLFKHRRVGVGTSFQYGEGRLKHDLTPFTEQEFWDVSNLFLERIGYRPPFITVISKENEDTVLKTVELAKEMDVVAKINYLNASGPAVQFKNITQGSENEMYVQADMYAKYIEIYEAGLMPWEYNTMQFIDKLNKNGTFTINDLKKSKHVVQINSEAISGRNNLIKVMKHELGHVFGLQHDNKNPLMTTYYNDSVFTGEITDETAAQVAANLRGGRLCQCASCAGLLNR